MFVVGNGLMAGLVLAGFLALGDGLFGTRTFSVLIDVGYPAWQTSRLSWSC